VRATPSTWNFGSTVPRWSEIADFQSIFAHSVSAVAPSKKVQLTLIGSPLRAFQWASDKHCTLPLRTKMGSTRKTAVFRVKSHFAWKKSATKFLSGKACKAFIGLYPCKNDWWGRSLSRENLADTDPPVCKSPVFNLFSLVAPQP